MSNLAILKQCFSSNKLFKESDEEIEKAPSSIEFIFN